MRLTSSLIPVALLSSLSSTHAHSTATNSAAPAWNVTHFNTNCSPGGCAYEFHIVGGSYHNAPAFNTTCNGTESSGQQSGLAPCANPMLKAQLTAETSPEWKVRVQHEWIIYSSGYVEQFYAAGTRNVSDATKNASFTIRPTHFYGVA